MTTSLIQPTAEAVMLDAQARVRSSRRSSLGIARPVKPKVEPLSTASATKKLREHELQRELADKNREVKRLKWMLDHPNSTEARMYLAAIGLNEKMI